jgi:hypothetical protein
MIGDWSFVVWIVILAIPLGLMLATRWSRSRDPYVTKRKDEPGNLP